MSIKSTAAAKRPTFQSVGTLIQERRVRWPIQRQLLLPVLSVVVLSIAVSSLANAWFTAERIRQQQEETLARVVSTLTDAGFPLSGTVMKKMSGLSGAEFVLFDRWGNVEEATLEFEAEDLRALAEVTPSSSVAGFSDNPTLALRDEAYLVGRLAVVGPAGPPRSLLVLFPEERWRTPARQALYLPLGAGAAAVLASVLVTALLARRFVLPIQRLTRQAASVARGEFTPVPVTPRNDEIRDLTVSLNQMADQLARYEDQVRRNERLRTLGQLGGGIAHQIRNSATGARLALELHEQECPLGSCETLEVTMRQLRLMETYLQRFLTLGRPANRPRERVSMSELATEVLALVRPSCVHTSLRLECNLPDEPLEVEGDIDSLRLVLVNLLMNAIEAASRESTAPAGSGDVRVEMQATPADRVKLRVLDSGPGPAEKVRDQLFEPFISDKPDGTGLGLSVARQVVEDHGGTLTWRREGTLTCFEVELPMRRSAEAPDEARAEITRVGG